MTKPWRYVLFLLWFSYMIIASILLFTRGFLLSRVAYTQNSTCNTHPIRPCSSIPMASNMINSTSNPIPYCTEDDKQSLMNELHRASHICLPQRARVVLIVIDALRYDFTTFDPLLNNPLPFQNKLPIIDDVLKVHPSSSRLYQFIADPPTTTMQRLKGLTTGSLPTFIDAGSNFATAEINEDNLIDQLIRKDKNIVFMGDDTWESLYPNRFKRSYPFPSFNVFDLDTVDKGVTENLFPELKKKDWDLMIGHYLGVDHCGHRYSPTHPEMTRKLTEMNNIIENVIKNLDDDVMLFVIGDHGMTGSGDHGGESKDEVTSAMFVYSKRPLIETSSNNTIIKQVDFVPTLATILGIPIPYSNLGSLVVNSLPVLSKTPLPFPEWHVSLFSLWSNSQQMTQYIKDYAISTETFSQEKLQNLYEKFALLNARVRTISQESEYNVFSEDAMDYMRMMRKMCEEVWVQFDSFSMSRGLVLCFISIFLVYLIVSGIPSNHLPEIFLSSFLPCSCTVLFVSAAISYFCYYLNLVENLLSTVLFATGMVSIFMLAILVIQNWPIISLHWYSLSKKRTGTDLVLRVTFLFSSCGLLSNSYILEEANVALFLLLSVLILIIYEPGIPVKKSGIGASQKVKPNSLMNTKLALIVFFVCLLARLSTSFWKCREEQRWCVEYFSVHSQGIKTESGKAEYLITLITVAVFVTATRNWLRACGNLVGLSPTVFLIRYTPTVMVVATGGFWVLHRLPKDTKSKILAGWHPDSLAWVVYVFAFSGIVSVIFKPLCIYVIPNSKNDISKPASESSVIPQLFNHVKELFNEKHEVNQGAVPIVCGLATVYSATFVTISIYISLLLVLLLGDMAAPSIVLLYFSAVMIIVITAISRYEKAATLAQLFEVSNSSIFIWMLLSLYFFYSSGHQPTFPNIAWEAAFIGTGGVFNNNVIPAALIIINTFGSYILMGISLPLLLIGPFTLYTILPSLSSKKTDLQTSHSKDISRGEILLYEKDSIMLNSAFVISCKYILCHAVRVFISMLASTIHCRHLMVWKIFAPKLIFESIGMIVTLGSVVLGYLLLVHVNFKVNRFIVSLNKQTR